MLDKDLVLRIFNYLKYYGFQRYIQKGILNQENLNMYPSEDNLPPEEIIMTPETLNEADIKIIQTQARILANKKCMEQICLILTKRILPNKISIHVLYLLQVVHIEKFHC